MLSNFTNYILTQLKSPRIKFTPSQTKSKKKILPVLPKLPPSLTLSTTYKKTQQIRFTPQAP